MRPIQIGTMLLWGIGASAWVVFIAANLSLNTYAPVLIAGERQVSAVNVGTEESDTLLPSTSETPRAGEQDSESSGCGQGIISINTASAEQLRTIHGIGPALSGRIIEYREQNGPFDSLEEIQNVKGIGPVKFERMKKRICL